MRALQASELVPGGFVVENVATGAERVLVTIRASSASCTCPRCGSMARRVHSRYLRRLVDLPVGGRSAEIQLRARRFFCDASGCQRRVFAERFVGVIERYARRTARLEDVVHCLAIALGGRPAATLSKRLNFRVSNDTLLRIVRRRGAAGFAPPTVVGIDDWAWKRNQRYGTLLCDLERRRTIALLPDREPASAQAWLARQPQISVIARDRGGGYAVAAKRALPRAI
jgi:transposase